MQMRRLLFVFACLAVRTSLAWVAKTAAPERLRLLGYLALLPAIGFFFLWATGARNTGPEVFGNGGRIWWNAWRPLHGTLYLLFAVAAIRNKIFAWLFLLADVLLGAFVFLRRSVDDY